MGSHWTRSQIIQSVTFLDKAKTVWLRWNQIALLAIGGPIMNASPAVPTQFRYRLLSYGSRLAGLVVVLAIPVLLTTSSLRFTINQPHLYEYGFDKYSISDRVGIEGEELTRIAGEIRDYFNSDEGFIDPRAIIYGEERQLFTQREIIHMKDVKGLVQGVYLWQWITLGYVLGYIIFNGVWLRRVALPLLAKKLLWGGILTLSLLAVLGLALLVGFDALFLEFHELVFSNDLWQLDPRIHNLIAMFPQGFFLDATILAVLLTIGEALLLIATPTGYLIWRRRGQERARKTSAGKAPLFESQASLP